MTKENYLQNKEQNLHHTKKKSAYLRINEFIKFASQSISFHIKIFHFLQIGLVHSDVHKPCRCVATCFTYAKNVIRSILLKNAT